MEGLEGVCSNTLYNMMEDHLQMLGFNPMEEALGVQYPDLHPEATRLTTTGMDAVLREEV